MKRLGRKSAFGSPRRAVFLKNACSGVPEALFFSKILVRESPTGCFSQKCLFGTPRSVVFIKNSRNTPVSRMFFSKTDVLTPWTGYFFQKQMFQPLGRA